MYIYIWPIHPIHPASIHGSELHFTLDISGYTNIDLDRLGPSDVPLSSHLSDNPFLRSWWWMDAGVVRYYANFRGTRDREIGGSSLHRSGNPAAMCTGQKNTPTRDGSWFATVCFDSLSYMGSTQPPYRSISPTPDASTGTVCHLLEHPEGHAKCTGEHPEGNISSWWKIWKSDQL